MRNTLVISDPTSALMLAPFDLDRTGRAHPRHDLVRAQNRFQRLAKLRKLLA